MSDIDSVIDRLDELEASVGRIEKAIDRIDDLEREIESIDTSPDVATLEDEIKGIKTEIYYMRDELK